MAKSKTLGNVVLYTIGEIIPRVLSFLLLPVLTKYLTTSDYGISSYIATVIAFLFAFTTLSVNTYALRTYYKLQAEKEKKKLLGNLFLFLIGWGFVMLVLEALLFPVLLKVFSVQVPFYPYFLLGLIINFFDIMSLIPLVSYRVNEDAKGFVMLSVGRTILQFIFVLLFVAFFKMGLFGSFLGRLSGCIPFAIFYFIIIKRKGTFSFNKDQIKQALVFSLPLLPGVLSYLVISLFDRIILERYVSLNELGLYSVASTLALTLNIIIQGIYRSFEQKIFREHGNGGYLALIDKLYRIFLATLCVPGFCMILFAKEILLFFTSPQYYPAEKYIVYLTVAVIISGLNVFFATLLIADNKRKVISYTSISAAFVSFMANLLLVKYFGVWGACVASILSFLYVYVFYYNKVIMPKKYLIPQICFVIIFFVSQYLIPADTSLMVELLIKLFLIVIFFIFIIKTMNISLSSLSNLKPYQLFIKKEL
jgi:O-antigen/teichoic acid export membrane protein